MPSGREKNLKDKSVHFNKELEDLFIFCETQKFDEKEFEKIVSPLIWHLKQIYYLKLIKICLILLAIYVAVYYIPTLNWNVSAIGRIFMIKFILPHWDWTNLYEAKCAVSNPFQTVHEVVENVDLLHKEDCAVCENFDRISSVTKTNYSFLNDKYLIRGLPVIIADSHSEWTTDNFTEHLLSLDKLIKSNPCDVNSNIILSRLLNLQELLGQSTHHTSWFLHFRNCDFEAVKATRLILNRPYFYSPHLEPAYSSWILMSRHYDCEEPKELIVQGLILVRQLRGENEYFLTAREPCYEICGRHSVVLTSGEGLLFTTDIWQISYKPSPDNGDEYGVGETAIGFITESRWD